MGRRLQGKGILGRDRLGVGEQVQSRGWRGRECVSELGTERTQLRRSRGSRRENLIPASARQEAGRAPVSATILPRPL